MKSTDEIRAANITSPLSSCAQIHSKRENNMEFHFQADKKVFYVGSQSLNLTDAM